jgi:hyperosmotically inducible periplasmic protein
MSFWKHSVPRTAASFVALVIVGSLSLYGCTNTDNTSANVPPTLTDSELENNIHAKLNSDETLRTANLDVDANAGENKATISGTVETEATRDRAVDLAKSANPGLILDTRIDVKPREIARADWNEEHKREAGAKAKDYGDSVGDTLDDTWIHAKIVTKLIGNTTTPERRINVDVKNNVVTLRGDVKTAEEKAEAARVAMETDGVKRVVNNLKVIGA